jgi:hypothetical protein
MYRTYLGLGEQLSDLENTAKESTIYDVSVSTGVQARVTSHEHTPPEMPIYSNLQTGGICTMNPRQ